MCKTLLNYEPCAYLLPQAPNLSWKFFENSCSNVITIDTISNERSYKKHCGPLLIEKLDIDFTIRTLENFTDKSGSSFSKKLRAANRHRYECLNFLRRLWVFIYHKSSTHTQFVLLLNQVGERAKFWRVLFS